LHKDVQADYRFEALSEIAQTINSIHESNTLLEKVLEIAIHTLSAERGFILLKSDKTASGFEVRSNMNFTELNIDEIMNPSASVVREVLRTGEPELLFEAQREARYANAKSIVLQKIQSIACVPLSIKNQRIGAIYLDSLHKRSKFTSGSLPFLKAFANHAAIAIENARLYDSLRSENRRLRQEFHRVHGFEEIIGQSSEMRKVFDIMHRVIDSDATVLIEGESGTGKELVARAIHYNGPRKDGAFLAFFCGSLPDSLLESELFGHRKGAFTGAVSDKRGLFEEADEGTFFLDEIGDITPVIQAKLLRVLQEGEVKRLGENQIRKVDVRIISATNKPLRELIKNGDFREDLFYRLNTISITLPPLRRRREDIPLLAHHFLDKFAKRKQDKIEGFDAGALSAMQSYAWPGNVRELENTIQRAVVMARNEYINVHDLHLPAEAIDLRILNNDVSLQQLEEQYVRTLLKRNDGNVNDTANILGVSRRWVYYKIKEWEINEK
jgi:Nif-specific regulatory protein